MRIRTVPVTDFSQNARMFFEPADSSAATDGSADGETIVVDPGGDVEAIIRSFDGFAPLQSITGIFLTHAHLDHAGGVVGLIDKLTALSIPRPKIYASAIEKSLRGSIEAQAMMFGLPPGEYRNCPEPDMALEQGDSFNVGAAAGKVLFTPGHSPGHLSLFFPGGTHTLEIMDGSGTRVLESKNIDGPLLLGGDVLFQGSIGRTDLPGGNHQQLLTNIREKIFVLPDETLVLTGHGPDTKVGIERRTNPFFQN